MSVLGLFTGAVTVILVFVRLLLSFIRSLFVPHRTEARALSRSWRTLPVHNVRYPAKLTCCCKLPTPWVWLLRCKETLRMVLTSAPNVLRPKETLRKSLTSAPKVLRCKETLRMALPSAPKVLHSKETLPGRK